MLKGRSGLRPVGIPGKDPLALFLTGCDSILLDPDHAKETRSGEFIDEDSEVYQ